MDTWLCFRETISLYKYNIKPFVSIVSIKTLWLISDYLVTLIDNSTNNKSGTVIDYIIVNYQLFSTVVYTYVLICNRYILNTIIMISSVYFNGIIIVRTYTLFVEFQILVYFGDCSVQVPFCTIIMNPSKWILPL